MRRQILALAIVVLATVSAARADIVIYNLVNYPSNQNGWTLHGTITADASGDIEGWNMAVTNGSTTYVSTSQDPMANISALSLIITPSSISLSPTGTSYLRLGTFGTPETPAPYIFYVGDEGYTLGEYTGLPVTNPNYVPTGAGWDLIGLHQLWDTWSPSYAGNSGIIATAQVSPEPASFTLLGSALLWLTGAAYLRRRRAV